MKDKPINLEAKCLYNEFRIKVLEKIIDQIIENTPSIKISIKNVAAIEEATLMEMQALYPQLKVNRVEE